MSWHVTVLPGRYADSVRLMRIARALRERNGVAGCEVAMGTAANLESLAALGVAVEAGPADVVIAVDAEDPDHAAKAIAAGEQDAHGPTGPGRRCPLPRRRASVAGERGG